MINTQKQLDKLKQKRFLVATCDKCQTYDFAGLLKEFWLELKIVDGQIGFWQTSCCDWLIVPQATANWRELMHQLIKEIYDCSFDVIAIACIKDDRFCVI
ncbi:hypothetical protein [Limosilactobacillus mucosae]|uniref:Uncharacterized protein n=1 Tax=Limosilactobacillus mucosae TaxID=97478 RepID=A0AAJ1M7W5_LIMMU|nr:hypothetical protein [Limosilactobacillus mucosae]MDC2826960.1 hypothetical protein [Limosilactobacillus mucosae]MDC2834675.1 hypothetical protein [Limosilactobacillus mucosae]